MPVLEDVGMAIKMNTKCFRDIDKLDQGYKIDEQQILDLVEFVNHRYDCADFRLICLIKTYLDYKKLLSKNTIIAIEESMLNFKYWMDEPGDDGMCFWSENHQLLFHSCEYFAGMLFPNRIFTNDGNKGLVHQNKARIKILRWLKYKFTYGFIEWHSNTYYEEDIAPLAVLIDHADDEIASKSKIIMDLLFLDMAMHSYKGYFVATSGRCYEEQKKNGEKADINDLLSYAFQIQEKSFDYSRISSLFILSKKYKVPQVIKEIAHNTHEQIIKDSMGLNLKEIENEILNDDIDDKGMFLWAMEAFTNKESINMTMNIFNAWKLENNNFLRDLKSVNIPILRRLGLLPLVVKILNPATQGVAIQRANTYTYKNEDYMMSTAQNYHPGTFGDQQHIWQATLPKGIHVFSTHPGSPMFDDAARNFSPSYWVGNGIHPHAVQDKNVLLLMYNLSSRKGYLEKNRLPFIHFFFPVNQFEQVVYKDQMIFGQVETSYIGIRMSHPYQVKDDELIIEALKAQFVVVLGKEKKDQSFEQFMSEVSDAKFETNSKRIEFTLKDEYILNYKKRFYINKVKQNLNYPRFDTPYVNANRKADSYIIKYKKHALELSFDIMIRLEK